MKTDPRNYAALQTLQNCTKAEISGDQFSFPKWTVHPRATQWKECRGLMMIINKGSSSWTTRFQRGSLAGTDPFVIQHKAANVAASSGSGSGCQRTESTIKTQRQRRISAATIQGWMVGILVNECGISSEVPQVVTDYLPTTTFKNKMTSNTNVSRKLFQFDARVENCLYLFIYLFIWRMITCTSVDK